MAADSAASSFTGFAFDPEEDKWVGLMMKIYTLRPFFLALKWGDISRMHGDKFSLAKRLSDGAGIGRCGVRATKTK